MACISVIHAQSSAQLLDSIVEYTISTDQDSIPKNKWVYQYNSKGVQTTYHWYTLPTILSKWSLLESKQDTFDENGNHIEQLEHATQEMGLGFPYVKHEWEYDSNGNKLHMFKYHKYEDQDSWIKNLKHDFKNDASGQLIQNMEFSWGQDLGIWKTKLLFTYIYNSMDLEIELLIDSWDTNPRGWKKSRKIETSYSYDGVKLSEYHYWWIPEQMGWVKNANDWIEYDSVGRLSKQMRTTIGSSHLTECYYDSIGNYTMYLSSSPPWIGVFHPTIKFLRSFNSNQQLIQEEKYQSIDGKWVPFDKTVNNYNDLENISQSTSFRWDQESNTWILNGRTHYYYQNKSSGVKNIETYNTKIFPNPTSGIINISGLTQPAEVKLYSIQGKLLKTVNQVIRSVDISNLPPGIYILQLRSGNTQKTERIIKR